MNINWRKVGFFVLGLLIGLSIVVVKDELTIVAHKYSPQWECQASTPDHGMHWFYECR